MTKRDWIKLNKEVYDKYNKRLHPGDIVAFGSYSACYIGKVRHFAERTVIIDSFDPENPETTQWKFQKRAKDLIKIKAIADE